MNRECHSRQSFLGENSQNIIQRAIIGVVGLGGGGSHIVQQLAHIGFSNLILFDPQRIDHSNLNRLVGATLEDVSKKELKIKIAKRTILSINPKAKVNTFNERWQKNSSALIGCDIIFGCVDTFKEREELEKFSRRFVIPYIDIGMDVFQVNKELPRMAGQIILSMPGCPCMRCLEFITEDKLSQEASKYGAAGFRPQVVWPNAILASSAVGMAVNLLTGWSGSWKMSIWMSYDGNLGTLSPHPKLKYFKFNSCTHFPNEKVGDPIFMAL